MSPAEPILAIIPLYSAPLQSTNFPLANPVKPLYSMHMPNKLNNIIAIAGCSRLKAASELPIELRMSA